MTNATYQSLRMTKADFNVAIAFTKTMHILYTGTNGVAAWREIEPHEVRETKDGNFVVVAMCLLRGERRSFRLDRISHYNFGTRDYFLDLPKQDNPEEIINRRTIRSRAHYEIIPFELNTNGMKNPYKMVESSARI